MHVLQIDRCLTTRCPGIHQQRLTSPCAAVMAAVSGIVSPITDPGRRMIGRVSHSHNIPHLSQIHRNRPINTVCPSSP
ncbi:MAG: hypothetical protein JWM42_3178 [Burkholderia sp.]|nr:hypothetical protein [Burkholderia sp.]